MSNESANSTIIQDHTIRNDTRHDDEIRVALEDTEILLNKTTSGEDDSKDVVIGRLSQQNDDLKKTRWYAEDKN